MARHTQACLSVTSDAYTLNISLEAEQPEDIDESLFYPGLVNISGTYCFMNSTMQVSTVSAWYACGISHLVQALASLSYLQPYVDQVHEKAEALDVPTPVIDALQDLLHSQSRHPFVL